MKYFTKSQPVNAVQWTGDNIVEVKAILPGSRLLANSLWIGETRVDVWDWLVTGHGNLNLRILSVDAFRKEYQATQDVDLAWVGTDALVAELQKRDATCICVSYDSRSQPKILLRGDLFTLLGLAQLVGQLINGRIAQSGGDFTSKF